MMGIILNKADIKEADQQITVFTKEEGVLRLTARSSKQITSKQLSALEEGCLILFEKISGKGGDQMAKAQALVSGHAPSPERYPLRMAYIATVRKVLPQQSADEQFFDSVIEDLDLIESTIPVQLQYEGFLLLLFQLLDLLGYGVEPPSQSFDGPIQFSVKEASIISPLATGAVQDKIEGPFVTLSPQSQQLLIGWREAGLSAFMRIEMASVQEVSTLITEIFRYHVAVDVAPTLAFLQAMQK